VLSKESERQRDPVRIFIVSLSTAHVQHIFIANPLLRKNLTHLKVKPFIVEISYGWTLVNGTLLMQKLRQRAILLLGASTMLFASAGCSTNVKVECGGEPTIAAVESMLQKELENSVRNQLDSAGSLEGYDSAKLRTGTKKVKVTIEEVRTVRDDPDGTVSNFVCGWA
jgi:hypothetical protein